MTNRLLRILTAFVLAFALSATFSFADDSESEENSDMAGNFVDIVTSTDFMQLLVDEPEAPKITRLYSHDSNAATLQWIGVKCDRYEIEYSLSKYFLRDTQKKIIANTGVNSYKITGLEKGSTYYVRLRACSSDDGAAAYSDWSIFRSVELPLAVVVTASDYQNKSGWPAPSQSLSGAVEGLYADGYEMDNLIICGDYTAKPNTNGYHGDPYSAVNEIKSDMLELDGSLNTGGMVFLQGNHDSFNNVLTDDGLHYFDDYIIYVMNTQSMNPNHQGIDKLKEKVKKASEKLSNDLDTLIDKGEKRPVIIATHVPLHFSERTAGKHGDNIYSGLLFNVINEKAKQLDIIYLFGHNHSSSYDNYLGASCIYKSIGSSILIPKVTSARDVRTEKYSVRKLNFTYMNAGYVGFMGAGASDDTLSCSVIEIYKNKIYFKRYSSKGEQISLAVRGQRSLNCISSRYTSKEVKGTGFIKRVK